MDDVPTRPESGAVNTTTASATEQDLDPAEVLKLAAAAGLHSNLPRLDKPNVDQRLEDLELTIKTRQSQLADAQAEQMRLRFEPLPEDERERLTQWAKDHLTGSLPDFDADLLLTPCPDWCETPDHVESRAGKWHAGAMTAVPINGSHSLACEVAHGTDGITDMEYSLDSWGEGSGVTAAQAREFAAGILRAADLRDRLAGRR